MKPQGMPAAAPATAAPAVLAMVLKVRIAVIGWLGRRLSSRRSLPLARPFLSSTSTYTGVTDKKTDSSNEHRNEPARTVRR